MSTSREGLTGEEPMCPLRQLILRQPYLNVVPFHQGYLDNAFTYSAVAPSDGFVIRVLDTHEVIKLLR